MTKLRDLSGDNPPQQGADEIPTELLKAMEDCYARLANSVPGFVAQWTDELVDRIRPELEEIASIATAKFQASGSMESRAQVIHEFTSQIDELLGGVEVLVTVRGKSFTVKGFTG